jgi:hypothetical protein
VTGRSVEPVKHDLQPTRRNLVVGPLDVVFAVASSPVT